jgi:alanine dehydrogenase
MHIGRAAGILLCIVTELQAYFHFDDNGARVNERIHEMWNALMPVFEVKELYDEHYQQLMASRGI